MYSAYPPSASQRCTTASAGTGSPRRTSAGSAPGTRPVGPAAARAARPVTGRRHARGALAEGGHLADDLVAGRHAAAACGGRSPSVTCEVGAADAAGHDPQQQLAGLPAAVPRPERGAGAADGRSRGPGLPQRAARIPARYSAGGHGPCRKPSLAGDRSAPARFAPVGARPTSGHPLTGRRAHEAAAAGSSCHWSSLKISCPTVEPGPPLIRITQQNPGIGSSVGVLIICAGSDPAARIGTITPVYGALGWRPGSAVRGTFCRAADVNMGGARDHSSTEPRQCRRGSARRGK